MSKMCLLPLLLFSALTACSIPFEPALPTTTAPMAIVLSTPTSPAVASAMPTAVPSLLSTPTRLLMPSQPPPTGTPASVLLTPVATAAAIRFESWSPNGDWLAYWSSTEAEAASNNYPFPPGTLHFLNVDTSQTCANPEFAAHDYTDRLVWRSSGQVIVLSGGCANLGRPCSQEFESITCRGPNATVEPNGALSPNGQYQAVTVPDLQSDGTLSVTTTVADSSSGHVENRITWKHRGGLGGLGVGGRWLTNDQFLIYETLDRGPLLVQVGGDVIQVAPELFGLPPVISPDREDFVGPRGAGAAVAGTENYHLVIYGIGLESGLPTVKFYHSETGEVEELSFRYVWSPEFSPDGRWLLLRQPVYPHGYEESNLWIRPVDPVGSEVHLLAENANYTMWASNWTKVATSAQRTVSIYALPEARLIGSWMADEHDVVPVAWSPDNRFLAVLGFVSGLSRDALFVVRP